MITFHRLIIIPANSYRNPPDNFPSSFSLEMKEDLKEIQGMEKEDSTPVVPKPLNEKEDLGVL